ncbi:PAS domain-containing protein [Ferrimonas pelagia]|uniref:PAS domain-containing protein n=1 Tax=Ferrimonas pelagia TaxID=1177826 RepID=A0ABP9EDY8_9GAMM
MDLDPAFYRGMIDTMVDNVTVLNNNGDIVLVNHSWSQFSSENNGPEPGEWLGQNYLAACEDSAA